MEVRTVHEFLTACLATHQDVGMLANYIVRDGQFSTFTEPILAILHEPEKVRLVVCQSETFTHVSFYLTESVRITSGFLEKMKNANALKSLSNLLNVAPSVFIVSHGNPVVSTVVWEDVRGRKNLQLPRVVLAQAMIALQEEYVAKISPSSVEAWKAELREALQPNFVKIVE